MAESAGLVLGGIPLILYALDNCHRCLKSGKDYWRYGDTLAQIRSNVYIQQKQFYITMQHLGLEKPRHGELKNRPETVYPEEYQGFMQVIERMDRMVLNIMENLDLDAHGKPRWSDENLSRVEWEWRRVKRSFKSKERAGMIDELQRCNTALSKCLERAEVPLEDSPPTVQAAKALYNPESCDRVRKHALLVRKALDAGWQCTCSEHDQVTLDLDWHENYPRAAPSFKISLTSVAGANEWLKTRVMIAQSPSEETKAADANVLGERITNMKINTGHIPHPKGSDKAKQGVFSRIRKTLSLAPSSPTATAKTTCPPSNPPDTSVDANITSLCQFVQDIRNDCSGPGHLAIPGDSQRINIIPTPKNTALPVRIRPLRSFLPPKHHGARLGLSRRKRFECAASAAWAVLLLCGTPWLDEKWDKDELYLFLEKGLQGNEALAKNPCIAQRHQSGGSPAAQRAAASAAGFHDRFILIELCLNRAFDEFREQGKSAGTGSTVLDDYEIANNLVDDVYLDAGDFYGNACQRCIRCEFPGRDITKSFEFAQFRQQFYIGLVAPVQVTLSLTPSSPYVSG